MYGTQETHLRAAVSNSATAVRAVRAGAHPQAFDYSLQDLMVVTYVVNADAHREQGICTLLPWGHIFSDFHQPTHHMLRIAPRQEQITLAPAIFAAHRHGQLLCSSGSTYVVYDLPPMTIAPWPCLAVRGRTPRAEETFYGFEDDEEQD